MNKSLLMIVTAFAISASPPLFGLTIENLTDTEDLKGFIELGSIVGGSPKLYEDSFEPHPHKSVRLNVKNVREKGKVWLEDHEGELLYARMSIVVKPDEKEFLDCFHLAKISNSQQLAIFLDSNISFDKHKCLVK